LDDFTGNVGDLSAGLTPAPPRDARALVPTDARALVAADMGWRARLVDVARSAVRPTFVAQPMAWGRGLVLAFLVVFALDLAMDALVSWLAEAWDAETGLLPAPIEQDISLAEDLFSALLLAPVVEEALFRGWLTGRIAALRFAAYGFAALGLFTLGFFVSQAYAAAASLAALALAFAGLVQWSRTNRRDTAVPAWFTRHFPWLMWGSTLLFGLIHLGNYEPLHSPLGLLVVLPQTLGGLLLAYTRTRLGLGAAMLHHAGYNAVLLVGEYGWF
jgi:membrane protease YdiL (CAAX protease family)